MFRTFAVASLFTASFIDASPEASASAQYRWLTTGELESLLKGSWIVEGDNRPSYMRTPEHFQQDGHYVRHEDNFEAHGTYIFKEGKVCDQAEKDPEVCRGVLVDKAGRYWIVGRYNSQSLVNISVRPIR